MYKIMVVDDEENILKVIRRSLAKFKDWQVDIFSEPEIALQNAMKKQYDLYISDYRMPKMDGISFLKNVKLMQPDSMRMVLSGYTDLEALMGSINEAEIFRFITKPWDDEYLLMSIEQALSYRDAFIENKRLASQVKSQRAELDKQKRLLEEYKDKHPDIFNVEWADDGSIILDESELDSN